MTTKEFTIAEVGAHNKSQDLFIIIRDEVYDLTKFAAEHPGGEEILIEYAGKEATETFDDIGHSQDAKDLMKKFHVGSIVESERKPVKTKAKKEETKKMACVEKIFINLNAPSTFNLRQKILGDQNSNIQYIVNETKANVTLRGRGSGFIEPSLGIESSESLHLFIEHSILKNLIEAKNYARNLLETIQSDLQIFLQTNQALPMQQPPPMITSTHSMTMPSSAVLSVPPPNILQNNATHIIQQPNFIPQTHIIPQQMQIIQQTPINIPPPLRTNAPISVQFQGQPANIQIQQAGQQILLNQAPVQQQQQQYQFQYIPAATAPQTQTIQHFIQPQQQIQGILQPHGQQFITLQGNTAFMIPPPNIMQNPFGSVPPITINSGDAVDNKADGSKIMKHEEPKNQLSAAGRAIVTNINQPPPPIQQQFIVNANPWPQNQQQMPLNSQIQILTQQPQAFHRNGNEIVIQATPSASAQGQQIITTFNPTQGQSLQQIQFANQPIISQPPPAPPIQQQHFSQAQFLQQNVEQSRSFSSPTSLSYQQQFEQKINMGPEYQQQRAMKRKIDEADTKGSSSTFAKSGMGAMTKNRPPPNIVGHQQMLKSRNTQLKSAGDVMSINSNSGNKSLVKQHKGLGTANMSSKVSQVEIAKSPPFSSTFSVATAKGENEIINTQNFDIANQAFMQQPPPNIAQQQFAAMPRGQMIMFQTQPPPPSTNASNSAQHQDAHNFQGMNQINMTRYNVPREMMMPGNNSSNNDDILESSNFNHQQQQQQPRFQQHW